MDNFNPVEPLDEQSFDEPMNPVQTSHPQEGSSTASKLSLMNGLSAVFNGLGIGLLLGILLGLSISPVVSGVIATLSSLLALFLGLNEKYLDALKSLRIGAFGLFAVAGILLGIYIRSSEPFAPSLLDKKNEYLAIGIDSITANSLLVGYIQADTGKVRRQANVLYFSTSDAGACGTLQYASEDADLAETVNTFTMAGGAWKKFAESFQKDLPQGQVSKALIAMRDCFCDLASSGTITTPSLEKVRTIKSNATVAEIETTLTAVGGSWTAIVEKVRERFAGKDNKNLYLSIINVLSHD